MFRWILAILLTVTLLACTDDMPSPENSQIPSDILELPGCFTINLRTTGTFSSTDTKAEGYVDGDQAEYAFAPKESGNFHHFMVAFKDDGSNLGVFPLDLPEKTYDGNGYITVTVSGIIRSSSINREIKTTAELIDYLDGANAYFLINVESSWGNKLTSINETGLLAETFSNYKIKVGETEYFTMTNSVYIDDNKTICASQLTLTADNVFNSESEAKNADRSKTVTQAYVERLAVKYTVNFNIQQTDPDPEGNSDTPSSATGDEAPSTDEANTIPLIKIPIKKFDRVEFHDQGYTIYTTEENAWVKIIGVGVTGLEPSTYAFKKISNNNYFTPTSGSWNVPSAKRCYWSEDPHYQLESSTTSRNSKIVRGYPQQFRRGLDHDSIQSKHAGLPDGYKDFVIKQDGNGNLLELVTGLIDVTKFNPGIYLTYTPFNAINAYGKEFAGVPFYSLENTYWEPGWDKKTWVWPWNKAPYSVATCLIIAAQVSLANSGDITLFNGQNDIFYNSEKELIESKIEIMRNLVLNSGNSGIRVLNGLWDRHENDPTDNDLDIYRWYENDVLWIGQKNADGELVFREAEAKDFKLIDAEISGGDGQKLIAPTLNDTEATYILAPYKKSTDSYGNEITTTEMEDDPDKRHMITWNHIVSLIHKVIGPIDVYTNGYMYYAIPIPHRIGEVKADSFKSAGDIGTVRNNWYNFTVTGLSKIGTPVSDPAQPIVPVMDIRRSYLNVSVRVIDWHKITHNDVPLSPLQ